MSICRVSHCINGAVCEPEQAKHLIMSTSETYVNVWQPIRNSRQLNQTRPRVDCSTMAKRLLGDGKGPRYRLYKKGFWYQRSDDEAETRI